MTRLVHLSDLHFRPDDSAQGALRHRLLEAAQSYPCELAVLTGDLADTANLSAWHVGQAARYLEELHEALGRPRLLLLPGNHDRRTDGLLLPYRRELMDQLALELRGRAAISVLGQRAPLLAEYVPLPGSPWHLVAYDSTYLPEGWISAGGLLRQEDLLQVASALVEEHRDDGRALLFLLHHHLVPTPVTDLRRIGGGGPVARFLARNVLPKVVANADREEMTMTALGAGTALSTLHTLGRPVVALHGHKHYPTARHLGAVAPGEADVLVLAAGSCGLVEGWAPSISDDELRLWPSFNVLDYDGALLDVRTVVFSPHPRGEDARPVRVRPLGSWRQEGLAWRRQGAAAGDAGPWVLEESTARMELFRESGAARYSLRVERSLRPAPGATVGEYKEVVTGPPGARLRHDGRARQGLRLRLPVPGSARYEVVDAVCATRDEAARCYGQGTAFAWVGLVNRVPAARAELTVGLGELEPGPTFASLLDLSTGRERPMPLHRNLGARTVTLIASPCPARSELRVFWPLP